MLLVKFYKYLFCLGGLLLFATGSAFAGDPFDLNSHWNYRSTGGDAEETNQLSQNYNLTYSKTLSAAMTFSGSVRYSESSSSEGDDSSTLNPKMSLDLANDLFFLNLNAEKTISESDGSAQQEDDSWGANWSTRIDNWPSIRLYFNQTQSTDDDSSEESDSESTSVGASIDYSISHFEFLYDIHRSQSTDDLEQSESESLDQTAQVSYSQSLLNGRVSLSASQQIQKTESTTDTLTTIGSTFDAELVTSGRYYIEDNTPVDASLGTESFIGKNVLAITDDKNMTIAIDSAVNELSPINGEFNTLKVWLYREIGGDRLPLISVDALDDDGDWLVYYRDTVDILWTKVSLPSGSLTVTEDYFDGNLRTVVVLDLPASINADFVKVVATDTSALREAYVDDIVAYNSFVATTDKVSITQDTTSAQTLFNSTVRITDRWSASYNLRRVQTELDIGDTVQFSHSLTTTYRLSEKVGFSFAITDSMEESDYSDDRESRSYAFSVGGEPVPTVNYSLSYTRYESSVDDGQDTLNDSINTTINASIYPDLTATLTAHWTKSENQTTGDETSSYGSTVTTSAHLSPKADFDTRLSYSQSESATGETSRTTSYGFELGYRPSDMLLIDLNYDGEIESGDSTFSGFTTWLWSRKLQSRLGFSFDFGDEATQQYNTLLSWTISRSLSLQSLANYSIDEDTKSWSISSSLNMVF